MAYPHLSFPFSLLVLGFLIGITAFLCVSTEWTNRGRRPEQISEGSPNLAWGSVSSWSKSALKRAFDILCVLLAMPILIPLLTIIALAIRFTSGRPVFFFQKRAGEFSRPFTILKFRTMEQRESGSNNTITTTLNQRFTPLGPFLRRWKLDELPQFFNILVGDMSLVGPRPKLPEHQLGNLCCRPGLTGAATIAFAREEEILAALPDTFLGLYYHSVVLPAKLQLDTAYMARATFLSDLKLIFDTAIRRWDGSAVDELFSIEALESTNGFAFECAPSHNGQANRDEVLASAD